MYDTKNEQQSNPALRTPHCCGQFALSPGKETPYIFSKFNPLNRDTEEPYSLRKQLTFGDATPGFPGKWHLTNERRNSILTTRHYPDLVVTRLREFLRSFVRRHLAGKPVVASPNVGCLLAETYAKHQRWSKSDFTFDQKPKTRPHSLTFMLP